LSKIITSFLFVIFVMTSFNYAYCSDDNNSALFFPLEEGATLTVNGDGVIPKFSTEVKDYFANSISAITPNIIKFGSTVKTFSVNEISPASPTISFQVENDTYNLHIWADVLSEFDVTTSQAVKKGRYFVTQEGGGAYHAAYMLDEKGKILYYYTFPDFDKEKKLQAKALISDFKFFSDTDGKIYYSLWVKGYIRLMDENFQPIDWLRFHNGGGGEKCLLKDIIIRYCLPNIICFSIIIRKKLLFLKQMKRSIC